MQNKNNLNIWDKYADFWDIFCIKLFFNFLHKNTLNLISNFLSPNQKILDIGCATGNFLYKIQKINKYIELYGVDSSNKMINIAKTKFKNINFYNLNAENINFPKNYFDIVTIIETLHHLKNQKLILEKIYDILKKNGIFIIVEPDINNKIIKFFINFLKKFKVEKESIFLNEKEIIELVTKFNFLIIKKYKKLGNIFLIFQKF
jgi:ubiquinone/menaquinone biosynthesis C-methylase UbiE